MLFYFIFPFLIFIYVSLCYKKLITGYVVMILMLFFSIFRGDLVGTDTMNYMEGLFDVVRVFYAKSSYFEDNNRYEYLYYLICIIIYEYGLSERFIITVFSLLNFIFLYLGAKRNNLNVALVGLFYILTSMYYLTFNISRQFVAISICFYAISFLKEISSKRFLFFFWLLIAFLFHKSSILCIIFYFCRNIRLQRNVVGKLVLFIYLIFIIFPVTALLIKIGELANIPVMTKVLNEGLTYNQSIVGIIYKFITGFILFYIYYLRRRDDKTDLYDNMFLIYMLMTAFLAEGNLYFFRLKFSFMIVLCIYLPDFFNIMTNKNKNIYILYSLILYLYTCLIVHGYHPYYMSFNEII